MNDGNHRSKIAQTYVHVADLHVEVFGGRLKMHRLRHQLL